VSRYLPLIADRLIGRPLLIEPGKAETILTVLEGRIVSGIGPDDDDARAAIEGRPTPETNRFVGTHARSGRRSAMTRASGRTALISVIGSLVNRGAWIGASSGLTSYEGLSAELADAVSDPEIDSIILDVNSPGGEVGGCFALAAAILEARQSKRIVAVVNDMAASAAYALASQADEIVVSPTGMVGSIGVVMLHLDRSGALEKAGLKPTLITAGAHKADANPFEALPKAVRDDLQAQVDAVHQQFLSTVAAGRGNRLMAARARATEAKVFMGRDAIATGLADRIGTLGDVLAELNRPAPSAPASKQKKGYTMDNSYDEGVARQARASERQRIAAILNSPAAVGRMDAAIKLATESDMGAEAASSLLATFPKMNAPAPAGSDLGRGGQQEIGASAYATAAADISAEEVKADWKKAIDRVNATRI
jgi:signal peptide peptidase SppA